MHKLEKCPVSFDDCYRKDITVHVGSLLRVGGNKSHRTYLNKSSYSI